MFPLGVPSTWERGRRMCHLADEQLIHGPGHPQQPGLHPCTWWALHLSEDVLPCCYEAREASFINKAWSSESYSSGFGTLSSGLSALHLNTF